MISKTYEYDARYYEKGIGGFHAASEQEIKKAFLSIGAATKKILRYWILVAGTVSMRNFFLEGQKLLTRLTIRRRWNRAQTGDTIGSSLGPILGSHWNWRNPMMLSFQSRLWSM